MSILDIAEEQARLRGITRVLAVHLKVGALAGVLDEALSSAYELASEGSSLQGSKLVIEQVPITVYCPTCKQQRPVVSVQQICCRVCGTHCPQVISGRELQIAAMEVDE
jgi:hydrogenase nickel incorporation protein HypA/HybF